MNDPSTLTQAQSKEARQAARRSNNNLYPGGLPREMWGQNIMMGVNMDEWIKYVRTNATFKALADTPTVLQTIQILTKTDKFDIEAPSYGALKPHYPLMQMARAGNLGARVRLISCYGRAGKTFLDNTYPDIVDLMTDWMRDPKIIPHLHFILSTPHNYGTMIQLYNMAPPEARKVFDREVPLPRQAYKQISFPARKMPDKDLHIILSWMCDVCSLGYPQAFPLARHIFLWYIKKMEEHDMILPRNKIQLYGCACMILASRTVDEANSPVGTQFSERRMARMTDNTYTVEEMVYATLILSGMLPPVNENVPNPVVFDRTDPMLYLYPMFEAEYEPSRVTALHRRTVIANRIIHNQLLEADGTLSMTATADMILTYENDLEQFRSDLALGTTANIEGFESVYAAEVALLKAAETTIAAIDMALSN